MLFFAFFLSQPISLTLSSVKSKPQGKGKMQAVFWGYSFGLFETDLRNISLF